MGKPAARLMDPTAHGGMITGPGCPTVLIGKMPAARVGDMHVCPMVTPGVPPIPHVGGPIIGPGSPTILIGKMPAATMGDMAVCVGPPSTIIMGCPTVLIGISGAGGGGGGGGNTPQAKAAEALQAGTVSPLKGTETYPIEIQAIALVMQEYCTPQGEQLDLAVIDAMALARAREEKEEQEQVKLTLKDFVDVFEAVEKEQGYEATRFFASHLDYTKLTQIAMDFINGKNTDANNDPNIMPTRFMLLYGADDAKLRKIDPHPDNFKDAPEHKITVTNLRKGLQLLGAKIAEEGPDDDTLRQAHSQYMNRLAGWESNADADHVVEEGEILGSIARSYGLTTWKYLYEKNKDKIGDNPDLLKKGTELEIPQWDSTSGDEKIAAKGADPSYYAHGTRYRYPWTPFSTTIVNEKGEVERKKGGKDKKLQYEIRDHESGNSLVSGEISAGDELETLIPDSQGMEITIDGYTCDIEVKG